jgi:hypothetical protein
MPRMDPDGRSLAQNAAFAESSISLRSKLRAGSVTRYARQILRKIAILIGNTPRTVMAKITNYCARWNT